MDKYSALSLIVFYTQQANNCVKVINSTYEDYQSKQSALKDLNALNREIEEKKEKAQRLETEISQHVQKVYQYSVDLTKLSFFHPVKIHRIKENIRKRDVLISTLRTQQRDICDELGRCHNSRMDIFDVFPLLSEKELEDVKTKYNNAVNQLKSLCENKLAPLTKNDYAYLFPANGRIRPVSKLSLEHELENVVDDGIELESFEN